MKIYDIGTKLRSHAKRFRKNTKCRLIYIKKKDRYNRRKLKKGDLLDAQCLFGGFNTEPEVFIRCRIVFTH